MMFRTLRWAMAALAVAVAVPACTVDVEPAPASGPSTAQEGLALSAQEPNSVAGSYGKNGVVLYFSSDRVGGTSHVVLRSATGTTLLDFLDDASAKTQTMSFFDGQLKQTISHKLLGSASTDTNSPSADDFKSEGDTNAANGLSNTPEYRLLPDLSRELGHLGLDGKNFPAALTLHVLALRAQQIADERASGLSKQPEGLGMVPGVCTPIKCPSGVSVCLGSSCFPPATNLCPTDNGADLRSNPCNNDCYGMCGPDCTCWDWVCGDCSYHIGCATHDDWCGACGITAPWDCALCYSPTAIYAVLDCRL